MSNLKATLLVNDQLKHLLQSSLSLEEEANSKLVFYEIINHEIHIDQKKDLIFISDDDQDVFQTLIYQPLFFIRISKFEQDIKQVAFILKTYYHPSLQYNINGINIEIAIDSIQYIESFGHYLTIHTTMNQYKVRENISSIIKKLPDYFKRVHKSYIVNENNITSKTATEIMINHQSIPIGRHYKQ